MNFLIESKRLFLRNLTLSDAQSYFQMTQDEDIQYYVPCACYDSEEETLQMIHNYYTNKDFEYDYYLVLEEKYTKQFIGLIIATALTSYPLRLNICLLIDKYHRKHGYMYEALNALKSTLPRGTELIFVIAKGNTASLKTVTKFIGNQNNVDINDPEAITFQLSLVV